MSRKPEAIPDAPDGFFQLTEWRPIHDGRSRAIRDRWRASLAVLGVRTVEVSDGVLVALWREGEEACSSWTVGKRRQRAWTKRADRQVSVDNR